jgi:1-phosphofructokinase family hexose kinase
MILTVTANPMMEHLFHQPEFVAGGDHRPQNPPILMPTGKPINVARALKNLGEQVVSVVAVGGATGREIEEGLEAEGLEHRLVAIKRESRRGFTVFDGKGETTTVYGPAPSLSDGEVETICATVRSLLPARLIVVGGSTSRDDLYARLCCLGVPVVLDTRGAALTNAMKVGKLFMAKPNLRECRDTFGARDVSSAASMLRQMGARWSVVTDQGREAAFQLGRRLYRVTPPTVDVVHTVGCGDALCAGLIHTMDRPPSESVAFAMACGAYAATQAEVSKLDKAACEALAANIEVRG